MLPCGAQVTNLESVKSGNDTTSLAAFPVTPATSPVTPTHGAWGPHPAASPHEPAAASLLAPAQAVRAPPSAARPLLQPATALKLAEGKPDPSKPSDAKGCIDIAASAGCEIQVCQTS